LQIPAKDKSEVFQRLVLVSDMKPLSGQCSDEANWKGFNSGEEICCIQAVSGSASNTGG